MLYLNCKRKKRKGWWWGKNKRKNVHITFHLKCFPCVWRTKTLRFSLVRHLRSVWNKDKVAFEIEIKKKELAAQRAIKNVPSCGFPFYLTLFVTFLHLWHVRVVIRRKNVQFLTKLRFWFHFILYKSMLINEFFLVLI